MFLRRLGCLAAIFALLLFATIVSADAPGVPTGTITSGTVATNGVAPSPYGYAYGYPYGYGGYGYAPGYIEANYYPPGVTDGISCGGVYGCPLNLPAYGYGTYVRGNLYCGLYTCGTVQPIQR